MSDDDSEELSGFDLNIDDDAGPCAADAAAAEHPQSPPPPPSSSSSGPQQRYEGERDDDGLFHGSGQLWMVDGATYEGRFAFGRFEGKGVLQLPSGSRYEGSFAKGRFEGRGTMDYADGRRYVGGLRHGEFNQYGELTLPTELYKGDFCMGRRYGYGETIFREGHQGRAGWRHAGSYVNDKAEGPGVLLSPDGTEYRCETFHLGKLHGNVTVKKEGGRQQWREYYQKDVKIREYKKVACEEAVCRTLSPLVLLVRVTSISHPNFLPPAPHPHPHPAHRRPLVKTAM